MPLEMRIGLDAITSYRRLAYTPWHALAEFVDNSTQAYFDNKEALDEAYNKEGTRLEVAIVYDKDNGFLRVTDNSIGMSLPDLEHALHVARPPANTLGRSKYGMGLKTAACWLGNKWTVTTKKLGDTVEHCAVVDVAQVAEGNAELAHSGRQGVDPHKHYTIIEIAEMNQRFQGRTIGKIRAFLGSMYRVDFRHNRLDLTWNGTALTWQEFDSRLLRDRSDEPFRRDFDFAVDGKRVSGWVGILGKGSRADAGFSIIHCDRVVRGWPDSWRPSTIYGQLQGSNDLVNQRLVGEIHLDDFDVSHTKDDILWVGDQEDQVEKTLRDVCEDYRQRALRPLRGDADERGPSAAETKVAVVEIQKELSSPQVVDALFIDPVPAPDVLGAQEALIAEAVGAQPPTFTAMAGELKVRGYLADDLSPHDPYVAHDSARDAEVVIVVNQRHPHWSQIRGSDGVLNYLRHCVYDGIAEWRAMRQTSPVIADTVKYLKDRLLRVPLDIEMVAGDDEGAADQV